MDRTVAETAFDATLISNVESATCLNHLFTKGITTTLNFDLAFLVYKLFFLSFFFIGTSKF